MAGPELAGRYGTMLAEFKKHHRNSLNIFLHMVTTPIGLAGLLGLQTTLIGAWGGLGKMGSLLMLPILYTGTLPFLGVPSRITLATCIATSLTAVIAASLALRGWECLAIIVVAYVLQEGAHLITGEASYESSYKGQGGWKWQFLVHTYLLLPLIFGAYEGMEGGFLSWLVPHNFVRLARLSGKREKEHLEVLNRWVVGQEPSNEMTTHWWFHELPDEVREAFDGVQRSESMLGAMHSRFPKPAYVVEPVNGMNEIYVACPQTSFNSDRVFYMQHIDGPFHVFPFCHVYRSVVAVNENRLVRTCFPFMPGEKTLTNGDAALFDFNREIHYITNNPMETNPSHRITLKVHYAAYPKCLKPLGRLLANLTTAYDIAARKLFRATIKPTSLLSRLGAFVVIAGTKLAYLTEFYVGWPNVCYVVSAFLLSLWIGDSRVFVYATSLKHYLLYIATYYHATQVNRDISFGRFKRDAVFFKSVAMVHLFSLSVRAIASSSMTTPECLLAAALIAGGELLAFLAFRAIGVDRTYFGIELGVCEPVRVKDFPYNAVPHPMIVGAVGALCGFHILVRHQHPFLAPAHILLYVGHLLQEAFTGQQKPAAKKAA